MAILAIWAFAGCETDDTQTVATFTNLILDENFDTDGAPNDALWSFDIGNGIDGWGNQELQYYTDRTENVTVQNGVLLITAQQEDFEGSQYTSGRLLSKVKFEEEISFIVEESYPSFSFLSIHIEKDRQQLQALYLSKNK